MNAKSSNAKNTSGKATKKTFDVIKPGKSAPSTSAKPIIITNRPILKDPMVVDAGSSTTAKKADSLPAETSSKKINPPGEAEKKEPSKKIRMQTNNESAEAINVKVKTVPKTDSPDPSTSKSEDEAATSKAETTTLAPEDTGSDEEQSKQSDEAAEEIPQPEEDESLDETEVKKPDRQKTAEEEKAAKEAAERQAQFEKLVDSRQYYLPINASGRRVRRHVAVGLLAIIILVAAWADIALDAGLIHLGGLKPFTHFFSN
jgi:hypothetical protein